MEMARYILEILKSQLMVVFSWGFHAPTAIDNGLRFGVHGFLHCGTVEVTYNEGTDLFEVHLLDADRTVKDCVEGIYLDQLVEVIDEMVERCPEYENRVREEYCLTFEQSEYE